MDYRQLNEVTKNVVYPLPRTGDLIDRIGAVQPHFMSAMDLKMGYHNVELDEDSKPKTAF